MDFGSRRDSFSGEKLASIAWPSAAGLSSSESAAMSAGAVSESVAPSGSALWPSSDAGNETSVSGPS